MPQLTAHSFKRGAVDYLLKAAEQGILDPRLIPLVAKHQDHLHDFPSSTLRYTSNPQSFARVLGTGQASMLL